MYGASMDDNGFLRRVEVGNWRTWNISGTEWMYRKLWHGYRL
jgi:hypothetical protein